MRLDKFLKVSRVIKRRTVANEACDNGRVSINGKPAKAGTQVKVGDIVTVSFAGGNTEFEILATDDNVRKEGAKDMYRIITSLLVGVFVTLTSLGLSSCAPSEHTPAHQDIVGTIAGKKIYNEAYGYIFLNVAKEEAGFELSEEWIKEHKTELFEKANSKCKEMATLCYDAESNGKGYSTSEEERIYNEADLKIKSLRNKEEYKKVESDDEMCALKTGMNVNEYKRFALFRGLAEERAVYVSGQEPRESELASFYRSNKDSLDYRSITYIYKKLTDEDENSNEEAAKEILEIARKNEISFEICAKGWSDAEDVKKDGGVAVFDRSTTNFPAKVVKWAFESEEETEAEKAELIETEDGYYIVIRNETPENYNNVTMSDMVTKAYNKRTIADYVQTVYEANQLKTEGFETGAVTKAVDDYLESYFDQDYDFLPIPDVTPEPTIPPYTKLSFEDAEETYFEKIGETEVKGYSLACIFREKLDKLAKDEDDYEKGISLEDFIAIRDRVLAEHKDELVLSSLEEVKKLYIAYNEYLKISNGNISETVCKDIEDRQKYLSLTYFETLEPKYDSVKTPDDAMRFMCGANAEGVVQYDILRTYATQFIINWLYKMEIDNNDVEAYYKSNKNRFRRVDLAIAIVSDLETAESVKAQIEANPKYAKNFANALREADNIERHNGVVRVTAATENVPGPIKEWAYKQTADTLITEKGKAEIIGANGGYYVIACVDIQEYRDELNNTVYTEVASAYKKEKLDEHFTELEKQEEYNITDFDAQKVQDIISRSLL